MEVNNPFLPKKRELIVKLDEAMSISNMTAEQKESVQLLKQMLEETEEKARKYTQGILQEYSSNIEKIREKAVVIKKDYPSLNKQYKAAMELHREAKQVTDKIKKLKHSLIDELKITRKKREPQGTEGQDRKSYTDDQDRESYTVSTDVQKNL